MEKKIISILKVLTLAERLKFELRHSYTSNGRQESVAEHTWRMSLMAVLIEPLLKQKVDTARLLKMIILHDLVEAEATDISALDVLRNPEIRVDKVEKKKKQLKIYAWLYRTQMDKKFMTYFMNLKKRKLTKQKLQTLWTS